MPLRPESTQSDSRTRRAARPGLRALAVAVFATAAALGGGASSADSGAHPPIPDDLLRHERNTIEIFRNAADSVVFVTNERVEQGFRGFNATKIPQNSGSGVVWDAQGHVLTNFHVIQGGNAFAVTLKDGSTHSAKVVGWDPNKDLAVLRIEAAPERLSPVRRGSSKPLVVGQQVLAIGNPFGLDHTLTVGVISALGREIQSIAGTTIEDVIQTDASINPGNSGGPLLDSKGRMIGVNTQIVSRSGQSAGIGFAVPIDTIERIVPQLIRFGKVKRAGLGVRILPDVYARRFGVEGVILREVYPNSPAARAGLRSMSVDRRGTVAAYDLIVGIGEDEIRSFDDLYQALDGREPGERVELRFQRGRKQYRVELELQEID